MFVHVVFLLQRLVPACVYGGLVVSCLVAPVVLRLAGLKPTLFAGCLGVTAFLSSRLVPSKYVVIPAAAMMGLTQGPFLIAQGAYIASLATRFSVFGNYDFDVTLCLFSGTYFAWTFSGLFVHTALEAALLKPATEGNCSETGASVGLVQFPLNCLNVTAYSQQSRAANVSVIDSMLCADGEMYYRRLALLGCYTLCSLAGLLLVALAVVPLNATVAERPSLGRVSCSVVRKIGRSRLIMVIPLMVGTGLSQMLVVTVSDYVSMFDCCAVQNLI